MKSLLVPAMLGLAGFGLLPSGSAAQPQAISRDGDLSDSQVREAFAKQGIRLNSAEVSRIRANVLIALKEVHEHGLGNSKVDFAAVEIAQDLGLDTGPGSSTVRNVAAAIGFLSRTGSFPRPLPAPIAWETYFQDTVNLWNQSGFLSLLNGRGFSPVKISWEDIGRYQNSVWGDRISDVGIWVRRDESDPNSSQLALSVRRDNNFRDKVLMVPSEKIKVHVKQGDRTIERTLPERLRELGLTSQARDRNVIVSNQFAIVPVPAWNMKDTWGEGRNHSRHGTPPRAAFNFSIFPYGSTNFVITDVIEGSSEAIVGPGTHQMLYANVKGQKAPFTASRAEDRQDLLRLEKELKAQGMDVDVQRYYLIQVPLRRNTNVQLANLGTPPMQHMYGGVDSSVALSGGISGGVAMEMAVPPSASPSKSMSQSQPMNEPKDSLKQKEDAGLSKVAIGHGEVEGPYFAGANWRGARAEEPIRVTVVYFVTPIGKVSEKDMLQFAKAFSTWDSQAIWGGSFVTKETK